LREPARHQNLRISKIDKPVVVEIAVTERSHKLIHVADENIEIGTIHAPITIRIAGQEKEFSDCIFLQRVARAIGHRFLAECHAPISITHHLIGQARKSDVEHVHERTE